VSNHLHTDRQIIECACCSFADASHVIVSYPGFKLSSFEQLLAVARAHYKLCQGTLPRGKHDG